MLASFYKSSTTDIWRLDQISTWGWIVATDILSVLMIVNRLEVVDGIPTTLVTMIVYASTQ